MPGNNKKGRRKRSEQEKYEVAKQVHRILKLKGEIAGLEGEKAILTTNLSEIASKIEAVRKLTEQSKKAENELRNELGKKEGGYQTAISQADNELEEFEERFNTEISVEEEECRAVTIDKSNLEATGLQLKNQIQVRSAELEATCKAWELEKDGLLSQLVAAKKETAEITKGSQMAEEAWNAEKGNLLSRLDEGLDENLLLQSSEEELFSFKKLSNLRNELVDFVNNMDVHEKPKLSNASVEENPRDVNEKEKPNDVKEMQAVQESRKPNGGHQRKTQKRLHPKGK